VEPNDPRVLTMRVYWHNPFRNLSFCLRWKIWRLCKGLDNGEYLSQIVQSGGMVSKKSLAINSQLIQLRFNAAGHLELLK
jgi:hypothetical protein